MNLDQERQTIRDELESMRAQGIRVVRQFGDIRNIFAHDGEIRQVLANLIGNAVDAMQASGGVLVLRTRPGRRWNTEREGIVVTVADTGPGMDGQTLSHIFEPFFSTKGITGTGLGLWISQEILVKHQGTIRVRTRQQQPHRGRPGRVEGGLRGADR